MYWTDAWKLGASLWRTGLALQETAIAAHSVVGHRSRTIDAALRDPLQADVAELSLMAPEKAAAFGEAGMSLFASWLSLQADMLAQGQDLAAMAMAGRPPSRKTLGRVARRGSRLAVGMAEAGGKALAPIHKTATANQRRLSKRKPAGKG